MELALRLAQKGEGMTSPNPLVGAVLVKNGKIIGKGYHKRAGLPHAEIEAFEDAKKKGLFGSSRRTNTAELSDGITNQIGLIFESMMDSILAGKLSSSRCSLNPSFFFPEELFLFFSCFLFSIRLFEALSERDVVLLGFL